MPFEEVETLLRPIREIRAGVRYMRSLSKKKPTNPEALPKLMITVPTAVFISKAERFVLLVGTGADSHKLRLKAAAKKAGGVKPSEFTTHFKMWFGHIPKFGEESFDLVHCPILKVSEDEYEITLPHDPCARPD